MNDTMEKKPGVYKITNKINGKYYYGSTTASIRRRWNLHRCQLLNDCHPCEHLQKSWNKYGEDNFEFSIVLLCDPDNCLYYEQLFLDKYWDAGIKCYNICKVAGNQLGIKRSIETKKKMSDAKAGKNNPMYGKSPPNKGKKTSEQTRKKQSDVKKGKLHTIEHRKKIGDSLIGRKVSEETRHKLSVKLLGRRFSEETHKKMSLAKLGKIRGPYKKRAD